MAFNQPKPVANFPLGQQSATNTNTTITSPLVKGDIPSIPIVDHDLSLIRYGKLFRFDRTYTLVSGGTLLVGVKAAGGGTRTHLVADSNVGAECDFRNYENAALSNFGTPAFPTNSNRNFPDSCLTQFGITPVVTNAGTLLTQDHAGNKVTTGGAVTLVNELVLKENGTYLMVIENQSAQSTWVSYNIFFYEENTRAT